ncbi:MAG: DUF1295 domain-containing protein [Clostridiales bacterium]|nr:DUF1295 domain-containing protein [Clostridiales bacterium]
MKLKENRILSILLVTLTYILASVLGIILYNALNFSVWLNLLLADCFATVIVFIVSVILKNASVYDPYWSVQPIIIVIGFTFLYGLNVMGIIVVSVVCVWGIRLTANWMYTFHSLNYQDWRYVMLKERTGKFYPIINFVGIHLVPTLVVYLCTMPIVFVIINAPTFNFFATCFALVSLLAVILQGLADYQMHKFRKNKTGNFIRTGLWKYSRHPNYLGEILMWWGMGICGFILLPNLWYMPIGAIANTLLFLFVSIPMADNRQSKKSGFSEYKMATRALLPIYKKQG